MRIAVISVHGCPCIQPGGTDAGGMNVYVHEVYERMARLGHEITVYSRVHPDATYHNPTSYDLVHLPVGEIGMSKSDLAAQLPKFAVTVVEDADNHQRKFDLLASHYWLSGVVGCELSRKWSIPHVDQLSHPRGDQENASGQMRTNQRSVSPKNFAWPATRAPIVTWTKGEAQFIRFRDGSAHPENVTVVAPGVDTDFFRSTPHLNLKNHNPKKSYTWEGLTR